MSEIKTYWISKYALSSGIEVKKLEYRTWDNGAIYARDGHGSLKVGRDCHESREDAVADAERRRDEKVASLRKQLAKLEAKTFKVSAQ